jgi:hypothetical protein
MSQQDLSYNISIGCQWKHFQITRSNTVQVNYFLCSMFDKRRSFNPSHVGVKEMDSTSTVERSRKALAKAEMNSSTSS